MSASVAANVSSSAFSAGDSRFASAGDPSLGWKNASQPVIIRSVLRRSASCRPHDPVRLGVGLLRQDRLGIVAQRALGARSPAWPAATRSSTGERLQGRAVSAPLILCAASPEAAGNLDRLS